MANFEPLNSGTPYIASDEWGYETANKVRNNMDLLASGQLVRNQYVGGSHHIGIVQDTVCDVINAVDFAIDNTSTQWSGTSGITVQIKVRLRATGSTTVTPRIYNVTTAAAATISGASAASGTATDYSGTGQQQTLVLTLASGLNEYRLQITPSNDDDPVYAIGWLEMYV